MHPVVDSVLANFNDPALNVNTEAQFYADSHVTTTSLAAGQMVRLVASSNAVAGLFARQQQVFLTLSVLVHGTCGRHANGRPGSQLQYLCSVLNYRVGGAYLPTACNSTLPFYGGVTLSAVATQLASVHDDFTAAEELRALRQVRDELACPFLAWSVLMVPQDGQVAWPD